MKNLPEEIFPPRIVRSCSYSLWFEAACEFTKERFYPKFGNVIRCVQKHDDEPTATFGLVAIF